MRNRPTFLFVAIIALSPFFTPDSSAQSTSASTKMVLVNTINGNITPKSVTASGTGIVSAQNMMYRHSVTIYDATTMKLLKTIPDTVKLSKFGLTQYSGSYQGAPVEGAYSPDGQYLYVTNYSMYGKGFNKEGHDVCSPSSNYDKSYLYRINLKTYRIDAVYPVGVVPKVVAVTPDNRFILVSNWCSYDLNVISVAKQKVYKTIKIGPYPRGIVVSPDSKSAYVAEMGGTTVHEINLTTFKQRLIEVGVNPRAIVLSPNGANLYVTLNSSGKVAGFQLSTRKRIGTVTTGKAARSLAISTDGTALFVVNYESGTMSKVRTSDFKVMQTVDACTHPIGVTYEPLTDRTWVACYLGQIKIYANK